MESVLQNCKGVEEFPFPHVNIPNALSQDFYQKLYDVIPDWEDVARSNRRRLTGDNRRMNHYTEQMQHYSEYWRDFIDYHVSNEFYQEFLHWFAPYIREYLPDVEQKFGRLEDIPVKEKLGKDKSAWSPLGSHLLLGMYTPNRTKPTIARDTHLDKTDHLTSGLLYMADPKDTGGGALELFECDGQPTHGAMLPEADYIVKGKNVQFPKMESAVEVPYEANRFVLFLQTNKSVHRVGIRERTKHSRQFVGVSYIFSDNIWTL